MARSTCVKCGGTRFEMKVNEPSQANYKYSFIQCAGCGGVVGAVEYFNIADTVKTHVGSAAAAIVEHVNRKVSELESLIRRLDRQR